MPVWNVKSSAPVALMLLALQPACLSAPDASQYGRHVAALSADDPIDPGTGDPPPPTGDTQTPCTNTATVYISENGNPLCTGVMLASDIVLTAAHCLYVGTDATLLPTILTVGQAPYSCGVGDAHVLNAEPNAAYDETLPAGNAANDARDLAVLRLAGPVPGATTASLATSPVAVGATVTSVGYGYHQLPDSGDGQRRCYPGTVSASSGGTVTISLAQQVGSGSSGGPVFLPGTTTVVGTLGSVFGPGAGVIGAASGTPGTANAAFDPAYVAAAIARLQASPGPGCTAGQTMPCRPDGAVCLVRGVYPIQGVCHYGTATCTTTGVFGTCDGYVGPSTEICGNGLDDDCDGAVDEDCTSGGGGPCDGSSDPCCGSTDPCCGGACGCDPSDPCCGNPDPCCGVSCPLGAECVSGTCLATCCPFGCPDGSACVDCTCTTVTEVPCGSDADCGPNEHCDTRDGTCFDY